MRNFVKVENDGTSVHIGGGCGESHEGEPGRIEICDACVPPAAAAGFEVEHVDDDAPKKAARKKAEAEA